MCRMLAAFCPAVVVFPHHLGPLIRMAPFASSLSCNIASTIRFLYLPMFLLWHFSAFCKEIFRRFVIFFFFFFDRGGVGSL